MMDENRQSGWLLFIALVTGIMADLALIFAMAALFRWIVFGNILR